MDFGHWPPLAITRILRLERLPSPLDSDAHLDGESFELEIMLKSV